MADRPVVLLGVTGGIAAYKAAELLRGFQKAGMEVRVIMTRAATSFVTPMTFEALSTHPVRLDDVSEMRADSRITHVEDSQEADIMVIAPATANTLAKMANGIADNLLTSMCLAFAKTVVVAPAMNTNMWEHPATQRNVDLLRERGVFVVEPGAGELACGDYGSGRMAEPDSIVAEVKLRLQVQRKRDLRGLRVVITAGGTREPIDAVRFIGNRSSGKMGFALARAAFDRGAMVDLIEANVDMPAAPGVRQTETPTAGEMHAEVMKRLPDTDILIMAAAVADYRVADGPAGGKIGKGRDEWAIELRGDHRHPVRRGRAPQGSVPGGLRRRIRPGGSGAGTREDGAQAARHDRLQRYLAHRHRLRFRLQRGAHPDAGLRGAGGEGAEGDHRRDHP